MDKLDDENNVGEMVQETNEDVVEDIDVSVEIGIKPKINQYDGNKITLIGN